ncbi:ribonuclease H-like domain-containing protein [Tanacetum coccineum]
MYSFNLENIVPSGGLACLIAKATIDESNKWHRRFSWVFFLRTKDETSGILKDFIRQIENQLNQKVKTIRCDNGTEFKNKDVIEFCGSKGIKREYSNARTPQQNGVAERKNRTLIEAARTMLADSFLPNTFWAEAVSTACYVLNRVLVTKPHNKTPYELLTGKLPIISYIRPFGCHVTILNTIDHLGKFAGKSDEGFLVGYSLQSKAFRVYNLETKRVEENLHITFLENKPNVAGKGPTWLFDLDYLTDSMNYQPVRSENQANNHAGPQEATNNAGTEDIIDAGDSEKEDESAQDCFVLPIWTSYSSTITPDLKTDAKRAGPSEEEQVFLDELERLKRQEKEANEEAEALKKKFAQDTENLVIQAGAARASSTNMLSTVSTQAKASSTNFVNTASTPVSTASPHEGLTLSDLTNPEQEYSEIPPLKDIYQNSSDGIFNNSSYDDEGTVADFINLETVVNVSPIPTSRIHSSHPSALILGDPNSRHSNNEAKRLISWQCKKQTIVATSTTEAEYVAAASCCGQVLWIQNQMLDYGFNFMNTKIYIDNESTICIVKNPSISFPDKTLAIIQCTYQYRRTDRCLSKRNSFSAQNPTMKQCTYYSPRHLMLAGAAFPKHNMVAYLEKSEGNAEFHEIIDFLKRSSIHHALTKEPSEALPTPSPAPTSEVPNKPQTDSSPVPTSEGIRKVPKKEIAAQSPSKHHDSKIFGDEETIAKVLLQHKKRVKPEQFPNENEKIDPKDKGKKKIEEEDESESESDGIPQAEKKFKQLESDEELARKMQEEWEAEEERNKIAEENAANEALIRNFIKRSDEDFISIGSAKDERLIKKMNEKRVDSSKDEMIKEESKAEVKEGSKEEVQKESKEEESTKTRKLGIRKKIKSRKRREDLNAVYQLVMEKYQMRSPEALTRFFGEMLKLKLESEEESTMALELIKFVKKILAELESEE